MKKIKTFIKECISELKKASWPTKDDVILSTRVVVISVTVLAIILGFADYFLFSSLNFLFGL